MAVEADDLGFDIVDNSDIAADVELEEEVGDERVEGNKNIPKRGKDIDWVKIAIFDNVEEFKASEPYNDLKNFSVKNSWKAVHAEVEVFTCKHARRAKWKRCGCTENVYISRPTLSFPRHSRPFIGIFSRLLRTPRLCKVFVSPTLSSFFGELIYGLLAFSPRVELFLGGLL